MSTITHEPPDDPRQPLEHEEFHSRRQRRIMALDVGGRRIGVAVSDETRLIATPLRYVLRGHRDRTEIRSLVDRWDVERLVVGMPTGLSGREGPQAADVRAYAEPLAAALNLPLEYWDERLTTTIAEQTLISTGTRRAKRREQIDAVAAAVILQSYLDATRIRQRRRAGRHPHRVKEDDAKESQGG